MSWSVRRGSGKLSDGIENSMKISSRGLSTVPAIIRIKNIFKKPQHSTHN